MKKPWVFVAAVIMLMVTATAEAHFGMLIPSDSMVMQEDARSVRLTLSFSHPFEMVGMELVRPKRFGVLHDGQTEDLTGQLKKISVMGQTGWESEYAIKRPGAYAFFMEPEPYWEPAEDCYIIHYTKTVVAAFGDDEGWDAPVGLKTEIIPLAKPFGLYAGNVFQGVVLLGGKPVPEAMVEVEYYNQDKAVKAPTDYMIAQTIKADPNGIFTYAAPAPGWWGFAALNPADYRIDHNGEKKDVELGAVIWIKFHEWQR